jgi:hypothetical protein
MKNRTGLVDQRSIIILIMRLRSPALQAGGHGFESHPVHPSQGRLDTGYVSSVLE